MVPVVTASEPMPPALPTAVTVWPRASFEESPIVTVASPDACWSCKTATSAVTS